MNSKIILFVTIITIAVINIHFLRVQWSMSTNSMSVCSKNSSPTKKTVSEITHRKLILLWTKEFHKISNETLNKCLFKCDFTFDKELLNVSSAVVYEGVVWGSGKLPILPVRGNNFNQIWAWFRFEPPTKYVQNFTHFDGIFNWTSTYRLDSDVPWTYGRFENFIDYEENTPAFIPTEISIANKSLVGWMDSHCKTGSLREALASKLQEEGIPLDVYGGCNRKPQKCRIDNCYKEFAKTYKFWLAFENSLCPDYLTEKAYWPLKVGMVPILYGHKDNARLLPHNSFINVDDFRTVKKLADHLIFLDGNPSEYLKFFEWRRYMRPNLDNEISYWCSFCTKLHTTDSVQKSYQSIQEWWYRNHTNVEDCYNPTGPHFGHT